MKLYATRRQCEQMVIALMATFGSRDPEALQMIDRINRALILQCKADKSHYIPATIDVVQLTDKEVKK